jgi:hypothetical protein
MKKIFVYLSLFSTITFLNCCKEEIKDLPKDNKLVKEVVDKNNIEVLFDETNFGDNESANLLKELGYGICNPAEIDEKNLGNPPCSPKFFKFFPFKDKTPMRNSFVLLIKANVHNFPLRRIYIYQREEGKLVKVNSFVANLIGKRPSSSSEYQDLVLRFSDVDQNHFNCIYVWKDNHYVYDRVEAINDAKIRKQFQDSMNVEILKVIEQNGMQNI